MPRKCATTLAGFDIEAGFSPASCFRNVLGSVIRAYYRFVSQMRI